MADYNEDALAIWKSLKPIIDKEIDARTQGMVQRRKATVTTAPSSSTKTVGVTEPFGNEYFVPFLPGVADAQIGDVVWVEFMFGASNAFVAMYANVSQTFGGGGVYFGKVDNTSTSTAYTAQIPGITSYYDGLTIMLKNGVVTSEAGFTININGLGAKKSYTNMASATADSTIFNIAYTMLFVYDSTRVAGGGWICYRGYDSNTNTIGYQLRTNSYTLPVSDNCYRYRLLFTSADNTKFVPANTSTSTNATAARTTNTTPINPFGPIVYYGSTTALSAGNKPGATVLWEQYTLSLGYSFNTTNSALTLTYPAPVYLRCNPSGDGSVVMEDITQALPSTTDGKIYIHLGYAYSATNIELLPTHPAYYYRGSAIRLYTVQVT